MRDRERGESAGCKVLVADRERRGGDRERREEEKMREAKW